MKTRFDLFKSAQTAAEASVAISDKMALAQAAIDAFKAAGGDPLDFDAWQIMFLRAHRQMNTLSRMPAPSAQKPVVKKP